MKTEQHVWLSRHTRCSVKPFNQRLSAWAQPYTFLLSLLSEIYITPSLWVSLSVFVMSLFSAVLFPFSFFFFFPGLWKQPVPLICVPTMTKALLRNVQCVYMIERWVNIAVGFIRACFCTIVFADRMKTQPANRCRRIRNTAYFYLVSLFVFLRTVFDHYKKHNLSFCLRLLFFF